MTYYSVELSNKQADELICDALDKNMTRDEVVAKWGEALVSETENHPVYKAAIAYRARREREAATM